jgi:ankyrin repeat protein
MGKELRSDVEAAATRGDVEALRRLLAAHGAAAIRLDADPEELTTLHLAAASGIVAAVEFLLAPPVEADARATRDNQFTPLHSAAMFGHTEVCELLLGTGADVNAQTDPQGYAPLHSAAFAGHVETIRVLLAHGGDCSLLNYRGEKPADTARRTGQMAAVGVLDAP